MNSYMRRNLPRELYYWIHNQCPFICPICGNRCGGIKDHKGKHQCPKHGELY